MLKRWLLNFFSFPIPTEAVRFGPLKDLTELEFKKQTCDWLRHAPARFKDAERRAASGDANRQMDSDSDSDY